MYMQWSLAVSRSVAVIQSIISWNFLSRLTPINYIETRVGL